MDPDETPPEATATLEVFERLKSWMAVDPPTFDADNAIPVDEPSGQDLGDRWEDVPFEVPDAASQAEWMTWMQTSFAHQYASDIHQGVGTEAGTEQSAETSSRSKSQPKQGA